MCMSEIIGRTNLHLLGSRESGEQHEIHDLNEADSKV